MKKIVSLLMTVLVFGGVLAACGNGGGGTAAGSTADYKTVIENARLEGYEAIPVVASLEEDADTGILDFFGVKPEDMKKFAISVSLINIKAYGIAIVLPEDGKQQAVTDSMNAFVEGQKKAFDGYLQDQYEIAKDTQIKTMPSGEVVMVMSEDAGTVMSAIEKALKG